MTQDLVTCLFLCVCSVIFPSGRVGLRVCAHMAIWQKREQIWVPLVLLFDWKLASSLDTNLQCLMA